MGPAFYDRPVVEVARDLVGCTLVHGETAGVIVETEAYHHSEPACHAYVGLTARTATLFGPPGRAYVYLSYGIHSLLNAVAEPDGAAAAVLIRALEPTVGVEAMRQRRGRHRDQELCSGPGKLTEALGVGLPDNGASLSAPPFMVLPPEGAWRAVGVTAGPRIGISKATERPWRFSATDNRFVSRPWPVERAA